MKLRRSLIFACFVLHLCFVASDYTTKISSSTTWGVWEGWGCSLAWWANVFGDRDDIADLIFSGNYIKSVNGDNLPGLRFNIARYNAGGCSWNTYNGDKMVASPNIPTSKQIPGYWLDWGSTDTTSSSWDWNVDVHQRSMLQKAKARGANLLELFSNSPMWWMCINHNPSGAENGNSDNLQSWNYKSHAVYLASVAKHFHDFWNINFTSVEPFNEPLGNWWNAKGTQEGCHFAQDTQAKVVPLMRESLDSFNLNQIIVSASDENTYDMATSTWNSFSSQVQQDVGRVNTHGYQYGGGRRDLLYSAVVTGAKKKLWNSEYGEGDSSGISMISNLMLDLHWLHPTAWVYWQPFDSSGWGFINAEINTKTITTTTLKYYAMAHFSRHVRPGMTIVDGGSDSNTIAAYSSTTQTLVLVTMNYGGAQTITYDLSSFRSVKGPIIRWETDMSGNSSTRYVQSNNGTNLSGTGFSAHFNAKTIQTFEVSSVTI